MMAQPSPTGEADRWLRLLFLGGSGVASLFLVLAWHGFGWESAVHVPLGLGLALLHLRRLHALIDRLLPQPEHRRRKGIVAAFLLQLCSVALCFSIAFAGSRRNGLSLFAGYSSFLLAALGLMLLFARRRPAARNGFKA